MGGCLRANGSSPMTTWSSVLEVPALGQDEIQVWRINLAQDIAGEDWLNHCLSAEEREQAGRFHFAHDRRRFVVRRAILRHLLAARLGVSPDAVRFLPGPYGKPIIPGQDGSAGLRFSCSHSADLGLIAIARGRELGVDLEQHRSLADAGDLARAFFSPLEIAELMSVPHALKTRSFFDGWARKEAFIKAIGLGLSFPLHRFAVSLAPDQPAALLRVEDDPGAVDRWTMLSLDITPDYSAALVFESKGANVLCLEWNSALRAA